MIRWYSCAVLAATVDRFDSHHTSSSRANVRFVPA